MKRTVVRNAGVRQSDVHAPVYSPLAVPLVVGVPEAVLVSDVYPALLLRVRCALRVDCTFVHVCAFVRACVRACAYVRTCYCA